MSIDTAPDVAIDGPSSASERAVKHWIGGEWVASGTESISISPATGRRIGTYSDADAATGQAAIDAAAAAFKLSPWRRDAMLRAQALSHLADAYVARMEDVVATLCHENGKLRMEAGYEAHFIPRALRFAAGLAIHPTGRAADTLPGQQAFSLRQPVGVAGLIVPWNSPAYLSIRALAPALAAGCAVVLKLPGQAAQSAAVLAEIFASVPEIPVGIVNMVVESGSAVAELLVSSPQVPVVSYTGSTAVGRIVARGAAENFKRVSLELGGKTPHLVFADADIDAAVGTAAFSCTVFAGQFCMTGSRILVQREIAEEFTARLAHQLGAVKPGPADDPASQIGPMIDMPSVERVERLVEEAISAGARAIVRGGASTDPALAGGAFYQPTLLAVDDSTLAIVQDETFGPVQTIQVFDTEEEAIALANDTQYGLSACIWSRDIDRPARVARELDAGLISINSWANLTIEFEEGGYKASGLGRLGGMASLDDFLEYKQIVQDYIPQRH